MNINTYKNQKGILTKKSKVKIINAMVKKVSNLDEYISIEEDDLEITNKLLKYWDTLGIKQQEKLTNIFNTDQTLRFIFGIK